MMSVKASMVSTIDNPYNPFTQWDEWYAFDERSGYHTTSFVARVVKTSDDLSTTDQIIAVNMAVDEIVKENVLGLYIKVVND